MENVRHYADQVYSKEAFRSLLNRNGREWVHTAEMHLGILAEIVDEYGFSVLERRYIFAEYKDLLGPAGYYKNYFDVTNAPRLPDDAAAFKVADLIELQVRRSAKEACAEKFRSPEAVELVIWCEDRDVTMALGDFGFSAKAWDSSDFLKCEWHDPQFFRLLESLISRVCGSEIRISNWLDGEATL